MVDLNVSYITIFQGVSSRYFIQHSTGFLVFWYNWLSMTLNFFFLIYHKSNNAGFSRNLDSQHNILNMLNICEACKICHWFMVYCLCCCVVDMCLLFILLQVCQIFCREMLTSHLKRTFLSPAFVIKPFFFSHLFSMIEHALFQVFTGASISGPKQIFASETEVLGRGE